MEARLKISYDPSADAMYVQVTPTQPSSRHGETLVDDGGVIIDTDADGSPRGYEFLSVNSRGVATATLPEHVAKVVADFIASGCLESRDYVEREYP